MLSACSSNVGAGARDEGPYALPIGFLYAGAPAVVASLWNVGDASTAVLMSDLYARVRAGGGDRVSALRKAKKALKENVKYAHPRHWAAFVWIGDPR